MPDTTERSAHAPTGATKRTIFILPDSVADQIAAGEVVERPASVAKELVENAIDAGAKRIRIELEGGGRTRIEVSDDGCGMSRDDALLALDRHATSKIKAATDLFGVTTFGFRGEALPSIASVTRFVLTTSDGEGEGTEVRVTGGRLDHVGATARRQGTTVAIRALFFNTPARRKFLRSSSSEMRAALNAVAILALAHPEVGFEMKVDGRPRLTVQPGQTLEQRIGAVWGPDLGRTLIPVHGAQGAFRIDGLIQRPGEAKPTGRRTQLMVNGRPFRDNFLLRAAEAGYRSTIHPGDRPTMFLQVTVDAEQVDVNVHPAKLEVRFRDRIGLERVVEDCVRQALSQLESAVQVSDWRPAPTPGQQEVDGATLFGGAGDPTAPVGLDAAQDLEASDTHGTSGLDGTDFEVPLRQLFSTYILYQGIDGLVIVDQHAAHERVIYESVMAQLDGAEAPAQHLLLPLTVDLTDEELDVLERHKETFSTLGFDIEPFGGRTIKLNTVPNPHPRFDAMACFRELVADLARGRFGGWANQLERFAATYACRAAVKAGQELDEQEMRALLGQLFATRLPPHDVHGRATLVRFPREELERRFGRR